LDKDGFLALPDGASVTLYAAHDGASLTIAKVEAIRLDGELVFARTSKRETYTFAQGDLFALALSVEGAPGQPSRRAGFA